MSVIVEIRAAEGGDDAKSLVEEQLASTRAARSATVFSLEVLEERRGLVRLPRRRRGRGAAACSATRPAATAGSACRRTRSDDRVHTSTITVAVLPEPSGGRGAPRRARPRLVDVPRHRLRRPEAQQDRVDGAADAPADRAAGALRDLAVAAAQPRHGARAAARAAVGGRARAAATARARSDRRGAGRQRHARRQAAHHPLPGRRRHRSRCSAVAGRCAPTCAASGDLHRVEEREHGLAPDDERRAVPDRRRRLAAARVEVGLAPRDRRCCESGPAPTSARSTTRLRASAEPSSLVAWNSSIMVAPGVAKFDRATPVPSSTVATDAVEPQAPLQRRQLRSTARRW